MLERILPVIYTDPKNKLFQNFRRSPFFVPFSLEPVSKVSH
ncbi:hypothetical protein G436_3481 [Leptospira interrogans serovar Hardjo str. Norma]|uniref:Uncharacterized protein n=1 Tax=Leptospira interrogans serovar Hardjo str. Norma TaxID=1279460 RepID=A0A0M3TMD1_LEPIR|nr:hypothetical protein G436_3481 [Leptospira interrogans serovar Hardjo str. Norma]EKO96501.1 hypothetical protein LEP1GSC057_4203 [Leptospira interrogans str. Brem 329]